MTTSRKRFCAALCISLCSRATGTTENEIRSYSLICRANGPTHRFTIDPATGQFAAEGEVRTRRRRLNEATDVLVDDDHALSEGDVELRECSCGVTGWWTAKEAVPDPVYCPLSVDRCGIRRESEDSSGKPQLDCLAWSPNSGFVKNLTNVALVCFALLIVVIARTVRGRHCLGFLASRVTKNNNWNERVATRLLQREDPSLAFHLIRQNLDLARRQQEPNEPRPQDHEWLRDMEALQAAIAQQRASESGSRPDDTPLSLSLQTRVFHPAKSSQEQPEDDADNRTIEDKGDDLDDEKPTCIICFQVIREGDRLGVLGCHHDCFHASCLKPWLRKQNVCPMCKTEPAAVPCYGNVSVSEGSAEEDARPTSAEDRKTGSEEEGSATGEMTSGDLIHDVDV